jgi:PilZ domain-containing protein
MFQVRQLGGNERRTVPRQTVTYRLDVIAENGRNGCLLDLSQSGMRVRFPRGFDVSGEQSLRIEFPRWLELGSGLDVCGRFAWIRTAERGATEGGFAFAELSRKDQNLLDELLKRLVEAMTEDLAVPR